jgi:hypothetical protein
MLSCITIIRVRHIDLSKLAISILSVECFLCIIDCPLQSIEVDFIIGTGNNFKHKCH